MDDAYSDLEKFKTNNPDFNTDQAANVYMTFKEATPTLSGDGNVGDGATQLRAGLDAYTKAMSDLVAVACPSQ